MSFALTASGCVLKIHPAHHISLGELQMLKSTVENFSRSGLTKADKTQASECSVRRHGMADPINVVEIIDGQKISWLQIRVALLGAITLMLDGFDNQMIGYVAPALKSAW